MISRGDWDHATHIYLATIDGRFDLGQMQLHACAMHKRDDRKAHY